MNIHSSLAAALMLACCMSTAGAATQALPDAANAATSTTGMAGVLRAQVLLDRAHFSPGEIDGLLGSNHRRAVLGYQRARGLDETATLDARTWASLNADAPAVIVAYVLTAEDVGQPMTTLPKDMMAKSKLKSLGFESILEALGERFHASPGLLKKLNPGADFAKAGTRIFVPNIANAPAMPKATKLVIDKSDSTLAVFDAAGKQVAQFPVSSGSEHDPLPIGQWAINGVATNPTFHYNPDLFWDADPAHSKATLAPGPNNPVGTRWIDLSKPHYGLHGTPTPASIGKTQSHGCVRLTNWDVERLASAVDTSVAVLMQE
ncbi:L,D-transpeptidase family protein [Lysobacter hankyongensis]|uniref:L,D-transpeptidase n=1 Tax=Lysobacter hankyongensis TaxID=1176535 RepID=A0ABP9BXC1_9GAMM